MVDIMSAETVTEMHLDSDEWHEILHSLKDQRARTTVGNAQYLAWLDNLILKVECGLTEEWGDFRTPAYGVGT